MNPEIVSRIIKLIDQTGEKVIMMDPETERAIVIMDLADYEKMKAGQNFGSAGSRQTNLRETNQPVESVDRVAPATDEPVSPSASDQPDYSVESPTKPEERPLPSVESQEIEMETEVSSTKVEIELPSETHKKPSIYTNPGQKDPLAEAAFSDLTQTELLDKINRDIAAWKTAQDRKRTDELRAAASQGQASAIADALEDEERFYLEPID